MPNGGIRIVEKSAESYGLKVDPETDYIYHNLRKTHNDGVFSVYTPDIRAARSAHLLTGLPDGYGRGRIIGDYRRVALYGIDALVAEKKEELDVLNVDEFTGGPSVLYVDEFKLDYGFDEECLKETDFSGYKAVNLSKQTSNE